MKQGNWTVFAVKTLLLSVFGLSLMPFLACVVQYLDAQTSGISVGTGYHTSWSAYLGAAPLLPIEIVLTVFLVGSIVVLVRQKGKRG